MIKQAKLKEAEDLRREVETEALKTKRKRGTIQGEPSKPQKEALINVQDSTLGTRGLSPSHSKVLALQNFTHASNQSALKNSPSPDLKDTQMTGFKSVRMNTSSFDPLPV